MTLRCEVCETDEQLFTCGSLDQPMLCFCPEHYIEHVQNAHGGKTFPGCVTLAEARASVGNRHKILGDK